MQLLGLPAGSTIVTAYLYWAGSGGDPAGGVAADYNVTFNGTNITADRTYTASYLTGYNLYFFWRRQGRYLDSSLKRQRDLYVLKPDYPDCRRRPEEERTAAVQRY